MKIRDFTSDINSYLSNRNKEELIQLDINEDNKEELINKFDSVYFSEELEEISEFENMKKALSSLAVLNKFKENVYNSSNIISISKNEFSELVEYYLDNSLINASLNTGITMQVTNDQTGEELSLQEKNTSLIIDQKVIANEGNFTGEYLASSFRGILDATYGQLSNNSSGSLSKGNKLAASIKTISSLITGSVSFLNSMLKSLAGNFGEIIGILTDPIAEWTNTFVGVSSELTSALLTNSTYFDGVSETPFGEKQEGSWKAFIKKYIANENGEINFATTTPIDEIGTNPIILGAPLKFLSSADPNNRTYINTFMKDGNFISIIPGKPKYNGSALTQLSSSKSSDYSSINSSPDTPKPTISDSFNSGYGYTSENELNMSLEYLKQNGISAEFNSSDKRYYTFEADYVGYYSYYETMLNAMYVKMGLATKSDGKIDMFTFFNYSNDYTRSYLKEQYNNKALGFYLNNRPSIAESVGNSTSGAGIDEFINDAANEFQRLNYFTGFGQGQKAGLRNMLIKTTQIKTGTDIFGSLTERNDLINKSIPLAGTVNSLLGRTANLGQYDFSAMTEAMLTTNGMKVVFPTLWSDSNYSKSISVDFEFVSPYGDPLSIFKYVYSPLAALFALALPRQANQNGYVNPYFVRFDIPGVITSDFAIISSITWTRGGTADLWTVDRLPRSINVNVVIEDLYLFLAMTKRSSFLSSNPNYSVFLDTFSGYRAKDSSTGTTSNNSAYWNGLINRLNGDKSNKIWNENEIDKLLSSASKWKYNNQTDVNLKRDINWIKDDKKS